LTDAPARSVKSCLARLDLALCVIVLTIALVMRLGHFFTMPLDRLDESYHRWLISVLTLENNGVYTDLKPMPNFAIVWMPLFQYLTAFLILMSRSTLIDVPRLLSLASGAMTCAIAFLICLRIYGRRWFGLIGGLALAFQPWHIDYSTLATPEALLGLMASAAIYFFLTDNWKAFSLFSALTMLTSYEGWFIAALLLLLIWRYKKWSRTKMALPVAMILAVFLLWCSWSFANTGKPFAWFETYLSSIGWFPQIKDPWERLIFYTNETLKMSFFLLAMGLFFGMMRGKETRALAALIISYIAFYSLATLLSLDPGYEGRLIPLMPILALILPSAFPRYSGRLRRRLLICLYLLLIILIPYVSLSWIFPQKVYVISPEYRTGLWIRQNASSGVILSDFPSITYHSRLEPSRFLSYDYLAWYMEDPDPAKLESWLREHNVRYVIWQKVPYSIGWKIFPQLVEEEYVKEFLILKPAESFELGHIKLTLVYEDSLRLHLAGPGFWEHDPAFGEPRVPDIFLYEVNYASA